MNRGGSSAGSLSGAPELCVPASRRVCLYTVALAYAPRSALSGGTFTPTCVQTTRGGPAGPPLAKTALPSGCYHLPALQPALPVHDLVTVAPALSYVNVLPDFDV